MKKMNELTVDKSLLIKNFETYKLSLEKLRTSKESVTDGVRTKHPNDEQFSFLHHKEFSLHNHLYEDVWNENDVYLITSSGKIKKALINFQTDKIIGLIDIWKIPEHYHPRASNFNASINFPSTELAVVTDGFGFLYILETANRQEITTWKTLFTGEVLGEEREFKVACSQLEDTETKTCRKLHCILLSIEASLAHSPPQTRTAGFETVLKWLVFKEANDGNWEHSILNTWRGHGSTDYVYLELGCQAMHLISDVEFYSPDMVKDESQSKQQTDSFAEPDYHWQQTDEDVKLWLHIPFCSDKSELHVDCKINALSVVWKDNVQLSGTLFRTIDPALTTWTFNNSKLELVFQKEEVGVIWTCLLSDSSKHGKEIINEELVEEIHKKLEHLCSEKEEEGGTAMLNSGDLEECDAFGESRFLLRFQRATGLVTHKVLLGSEQWLFSVQIDGTRLPAFCMRRDVDGLVWQPLQPQTETDSLKCTHIHTFPAFGYIAASRQDKKFLIAPPNLSYVAIVNSIGHVIVFRKINLSGDSILKNRKTCTTTKSLYVQNLVNLDSNCQTVGAVASNQYLFVLTSKDLVMININ